MYVFNSWPFALFSANLHRFMSKFSWEEHQGLYEKWLAHHQKKRLSHELCNKSIHSDIKLKCQTPSILTLFHLGDHFVWPVLLAQQEIRFNVILDRDVYQGAKDVFDRLLYQLSIYGHTPELLFSDDPMLLLKIRSRRAEGQHLLCFADGASGANGAKKDERIPIPFLEGKIWLKKGIPVISKLFQMPVLVLMPEAGQLRIGRQLEPAVGEVMDRYAERCLRELYNRLERIVQETPHLWECWGYLHRNGMLGKMDDFRAVRDENGLIRLPWRDREIWFDRVNYAASSG